MPFKEGGSTRDMLLGSLMLEQYGSMRRYSAGSLMLEQYGSIRRYHWYKGARHQSRPARRHALEDRTELYISYSVAAGAKARTLVQVRSR
jgi:hypothetical protein